ncbi:MAG: hypothetical protein B6D62_04530 [Candidatus Cloacimonas sp. 4484_275]|nr:MAG: hypothetical protein B6D62_04530 [Candidatus Cloacimonas sp. 4484_275]
MKSNKRKLILFLVIIGLIIGCASMSSHKTQYYGLDEKLANRDFAGAISQIENAKDKYYKSKDRVQYYLDLGMLYHYNREFEKSNELLTKAEYAIEELYTKSISKAAASLLVNDNMLDYFGEDYEDIYLNVFKALNYLEMNQFDDAFVEIRRINIKLTKLEDKYSKLADSFNLSPKKKKKFKAGKSNFHNSALGRCLSMLLYRTEGKLDDAEIDKKQIEEAWKLQSHLYNFPMPKFDDYLKNNGKAKIDVLGFIGKSPDKKAKTLYIHTEKDMLIIANTKENPRGKQNLKEMDIINWPGIKEGYHFKFQLPYMVKRSSKVRKIKVIVDGKSEKELQLLESMEDVALETYKIKEPIIYLKTITRAVLKGLAAAKGKEKMTAKIDNPILGFAARMATDLAVDATENADLRISRFFPAKALIGEVEVQPGVHHLKIEYYSANGTLLFTDDCGEKEFSANKLNLIESFYLN